VLEVAASEWSVVTTVQPSESVSTSALPRVSIGSMAMQTPGSNLHSQTSRPVVGDLEIFVHLGADTVPDIRPDDVASSLDGHVLNRA